MAQRSDHVSSAGRTLPFKPVLLLLALTCLVFAIAPRLYAVERYSIPLDGTWDFLPRLGDRGEGGRHRFESPEALRESWRRIEVPSCYQRVFEDLRYFEGVSWYARKFRFGDDPGDVCARLVFEGVNYRCRVYLNGKVLGDHEGGYTTFAMPVQGALLRGENTVAVRVDSRRHLLRLPGDVGWLNYGGIYRPVRLEVMPQVHLADLAVRTKIPGPAAILGVNATVEGPMAGSPAWADLRLEVLDKQGNSVSVGSRGFIWTGGKESLYLELRVNEHFVQQWSPENPYLYRLRARLSLDEKPADQQTATFGIRTLSARGRDFLLSGKPIKLRGICYLYDFDKTGRTLDPEAFAGDLANFRELGINALRNHFPLEPRMLDACDSLGILVWHDIPVYWVSGYDPCDLRLAKEMIGEMALADRSRACMAVWNLGNENRMERTDRAAFFTALRDELHSYLPGALTTCALTQGSFRDVMYGIVDLLSENIYPGWYTFLNRDPVMWRADTSQMDLDKYEQDLRREIADCPDMPVIISEVGAGAAYGMYKNDPWRLFSEDYQAYLLGRQLGMIASIGEVSGIFQFLYNDFYDPSRMEAPGQEGKNLKGLVTIDRKRKKAFGVLRDFYQKWGR
ncbi:MAG: beta galactosidase jelly roll domain-containing protein [Candidatus Glassbacteria bacterium]|nr:beta galactosidase jelly roll domain-containing protein [Candidatus Glassbacteria bacterium]